MNYESVVSALNQTCGPLKDDQKILITDYLICQSSDTQSSDKEHVTDNSDEQAKHASTDSSKDMKRRLEIIWIGSRILAANLNDRSNRYK